MRGVNGFDDVFGIARCGNADQHVAHPPQGADLFAENVVEAVIVADGGEGGGVGGEGNGGQLHAFLLKAAGHFGGKVLGVGCGTAVAANKDFAVVGQCVK